ncbi:MAG: helix-turn-helix domain-containing protein, partial [Alphaproteobacteria bacterium]
TVSGVSARSLFAGFRAYRGQGPMAFLKQVRLERARAELAAADPGRARVIDIALKWHFSHMGRFAADYGRRFGEAPSVTLRRINR